MFVGRSRFDVETKDLDQHPYLQLLAAIIWRAVQDGQSKRLDQALDAVTWLYEDGGEYIHYLGVEPVYYFDFLDRTLPPASEYFPPG